MTEFSFKVLSQMGNARTGLITTPHGTIKTPVYMPVGTQGSVKSLTNEDLEDLGAQIILGNTYHLYLRPGVKTLAEIGGLHRFMGWNKPILTDSGGYQVSSLGLFRDEPKLSLSRVDDEGVTFISHLDGSTHRLTPLKAIEIQTVLGSDIMMAFDEATPEKGKTYARKAMRRTHRWLSICKETWIKSERQKKEQGRGLPQALFGIIQGSGFKDLRRESVQFVVEQDLPGIALGGAAVGQSADQTADEVTSVREYLPPNKPVYLMGVGVSPAAAIAAIQAGADMFDCVAPMRLARCGLLYTGYLEGNKWVSEDSKDRLMIEKQRYAIDQQPIEPTCDCFACSHGYSRAYLHHLFKARELTYYRLATIHNVRMMVKTVQSLRQGIEENRG